MFHSVITKIAIRGDSVAPLSANSLISRRDALVLQNQFVVVQLDDLHPNVHWWIIRGVYR